MHTNIKITWICQGGFLFEYEGLRIVADPYMSDVLQARGFGRMVPPPISYENLKPDWVVFTHDHIDHFDEITVAEICSLYPNCKFAGPQSTLEHFKKLGFHNEFCVLEEGKIFQFAKNISLDVTPAFHTDKFAIGLLFEFGEKLVWLSGDSVFDISLAKNVAQLAGGKQISLAMICINGKLGNMDADEAARVIVELRPALAMPMHYGLFAGNTADPQPFAEKLRQNSLKCLIAEAGKPFEIT